MLPLLIETGFGHAVPPSAAGSLVGPVAGPCGGAGSRAAPTQRTGVQRSRRCEEQDEVPGRTRLSIPGGIGGHSRSSNFYEFGRSGDVQTLIRSSLHSVLRQGGQVELGDLRGCVRLIEGDEGNPVSRRDLKHST